MAGVGNKTVSLEYHIVVLTTHQYISVFKNKHKKVDYSSSRVEKGTYFLLPLLGAIPLYRRCFRNNKQSPAACFAGIFSKLLRL